MKNLRIIYQKLLIRIYLSLESRINDLAQILNGGIHPKHDIIKYHQFFVDNIEYGSKVLDIGCGDGYVDFYIADKAKKVIAIDVNKKSIQIAKKINQKENVEYILGNALIYEFKEYFDYIILSNILEHIKNRIEFLNHLKNKTNFFLIRVPMINRSWLPLYFKTLGFDYRMDKGHYIEYTLDSFINEMETAGLKIISYSIQFGEIWSKFKT